MCIQRSTIFLIISLMVINSCNNQLLSADTADLKQKLPFDIFYVIFEHGTETTNQNLSRTCTTLNNLRRCYREDRSSAYNEKVRHPRPRRWLDECGRLKGDWLNSFC